MGGSRIGHSITSIDDQKHVPPPPTRRRVIFNWAARALAATIALSAMNINNLGVNNAMAGTHTVAPAPVVDEAQEATRAVGLFKEFLTTGNASKGREFSDLYNRYNSQVFVDTFRRQFKTTIIDDASITGKFMPILTSFKRLNGGNGDPIAFAELMVGVFSGLDSSDIAWLDGIRTKYGDRMISDVVMPLLEATGREAEFRQLIPRRTDQVESTNQEALQEFAQEFAIPLEGCSTREQILNRIGGRIRDEFFLSDDQVAMAMTKALLQSYASLGQKDRSRFFEWIDSLGLKEKATLLTAVGAFGPGVVATGMESAGGTKSYKLTRGGSTGTPIGWETANKKYKEWYAEQDRKSAEQLAKERELQSRYPAYVRQTEMTTLITAFENEPTGQGYDYLELRVRYLRERKELIKDREDEGSKAEVGRIDAELLQLHQWFKEFDLDLKGGVNNLDNNMIAFKKGGLWLLQQSYWNMREGNVSVISFLEAASTNPKLYEIYKRYLFNLDSHVLGIFDGIDQELQPAELHARMRLAIGSIREDAVARGTLAWTTDYYIQGAMTTTDSESEPRVAEMYRRAATLDPTTYYVFSRYAQTVESNLVGSPEERKLVAQTVAKLYAIDPALAIGYIRAITNLAGICRDQADTFELALIKIAAKIDARASGLYSAVSPTEMLPLNTRRVVTDLSFAFEAIARLDMSEFTRYDRYSLLDDSVYIDPNAPHAITHRPAPWKYPLTPPYDSALRTAPPYFLPSMLNPLPYIPTTLGMGGVFNANTDASGQVTMPMISMLDVNGQTAAVGSAFRLYLDEPIGIMGVPTFLPGSAVVRLSSTRLMGEIDRAFIPLLYEPYTFDPLGGGAAVGGTGTKASEESEYSGMVGGLGSIITSEGGIAAGGSYSGEDTGFAGLTAIAVPVCKVHDLPLVGPMSDRLDGSKGDADNPPGLQQATAGYQITEAERRALAQALVRAGYPSNPRELRIAVNFNESRTEMDEEGKPMGWSNAKYFWVDKEGTIFEIEGGTNDYVQMFNYLSVYADQQFNQPVTYSANVEPTVQSENPDMRRGGAVTVWDMGKSAGLAHFQAVPMLAYEGDLEAGKNIPLLLEWTPGFATTKESGGQANTYAVTLPGELLFIRPGSTEIVEAAELGGDLTSRDFVVQDIVFRRRTVEGNTAWELVVGGGGGAVMETTYEEGRAGEEQTQGIGRGGFLIKWEDKSKGAGWKSKGGGLYYESVMGDLQTTAIAGSLDNADEIIEEIESLQRIGATLYGSRQLRSRMLIGVLGNIVAEFTTENYEDTFWRLIGFLSSLERIEGRTKGVAVKADYQRERGLMGQIQQGYSELSTQVAQNPEQAESLIDTFQDKYEDDLMQIFDRYYLGAQVNEDGSLQFSLITREEADQWTKQHVDSAYGKFVYRFGSGFVRAYASMPIWAMTGFDETGVEQYGMVGAGTEFDAFDGILVQRVAFNVGAILSYEDREDGLRDWAQSIEGKPLVGPYVDAAARVLSTVVEDLEEFRELKRKAEKYQELLLTRGKAVDFSKIPESDREAICNLIMAMPRYEDWITPAQVDAVRRGTSFEITDDQAGFLQNVLWNWFGDEKAELEQRFNTNVRNFRLYAGGSAYFVPTTKTDKEGEPIERRYEVQYDIALFAEKVDKWAAYVVLAKRDEHAVFAGTDVHLSSKLTLGASAGVTIPGGETSGALSLRHKLGPGQLGIVGYWRTFDPVIYRRPGLGAYSSEAALGWGGVLTYTIGSTQVPNMWGQAPREPWGMR